MCKCTWIWLLIHDHTYSSIKVNMDMHISLKLDLCLYLITSWMCPMPLLLEEWGHRPDSEGEGHGNAAQITSMYMYVVLSATCFEVEFLPACPEERIAARRYYVLLTYPVSTLGRVPCYLFCCTFISCGETVNNSSSIWSWSGQWCGGSLALCAKHAEIWLMGQGGSLASHARSVWTWRFDLPA